MPKQIDFRKQRRVQGRALTSRAEELEVLAMGFAEERNIDLTSRLNELSAQ